MKRSFVPKACLCLFLAIVIVLPLAAEKKYKEGLDALNAGKYNEAIAFFQKQVEKEKDSGELASHSSFLLGLSYYNNRQYPEAIKYLDRAIKIYRKGMHVFGLDDAWYFWLGKAYYDNGQYKEAIPCFREASDIAFLMPAKKYDDAPNIPEVRFGKEYYIPLSPPKYACYLWLGNALYSDGQYEEAIGALNKAIELNPKGSGYCRTMVAASFRELKKYEEAIKAAQDAINLQPDDFTYMVLASIYRDQGENQAAISTYQKAIGLKPDNVDAYVNIASLYVSDEKYSEAADILKKAPSSPKVGLNLCLSLMGAGKYDEAISACGDEIKKWTVTGVGIEIALVDKYPVVTAVMPSFAADRAKIQAGDKIVSINGISARGLEAEKIKQLLGPEEGTQVTLVIERKSEKTPLKVVLTSEYRINTNAAASFGMRSMLEFITGRVEEADKDAKNGFGLDPNNLWTKRAISLTQIGWNSQKTGGENLAETIKMLSGMAEDFDHLLLALAYCRTGNFSQAAETYASVPGEYIESINVFRHEFVGAVLEALEPYTEKEKELIKTLEEKGQYKEALNEYAQLVKISSGKEASQIRKHVGQLIKTTPDLVSLPEEARKHILRAEVLNGDKNFTRAVAEYNEALKIAPFYPETYRAIALTYGELKAYNQAIKSLNAYLELCPDAPDARALMDKIIKWEFLLEEQKK